MELAAIRRLGAHRHALQVLCLAPVLCCVAAVGLSGPLHEHTRAVELWLALGGIGWLAASLLGRAGYGSTWAILVGWAALRLLALGPDPGLSDDIWRYVWEGGQVLDARSPYAAAPDSQEMERYRQAWPEVYERMNHKDLSAIYPPGAQAAFATVVGLAGGPQTGGGERAQFALRLFFALCDGGVLLVLLGMLSRRGLPAGLAVVWAWSPLVSLEFAGAGHLDSLGILALMGALAVAPLAASRAVDAEKRPSWRVLMALALLSFAAMVKLLPLCALPFLAREQGRERVPRGRTLARVLFTILLCTLSFLPLWWMEGGLRGLANGLAEYSFRWESFNIVYRFVERLFHQPRDEGLTDPRRLGRALMTAVWLVLAMREWWRGSGALRASYVLLGAYLVLSPTLHPWYLCWLVPFLALYPSLAWWLLLALAPLCYWPLAGWKAIHVWCEPPWLWPAVALPFLIVWAWELWSGRRRRMPA